MVSALAISSFVCGSAVEQLSGTTVVVSVLKFRILVFSEPSGVTGIWTLGRLENVSGIWVTSVTDFGQFVCCLGCRSYRVDYVLIALVATDVRLVAYPCLLRFCGRKCSGPRPRVTRDCSINRMASPLLLVSFDAQKFSFLSFGKFFSA